MTTDIRRARCWAEIDLGMVAHNFTTACEENPGATVIPVIKADAYGLGAKRVAPTLEKAGAKILAVAEYGEAAEIRELVNTDILVMGFTHEMLFADAIANDIILTVTDLEQAKLLDAAAQNMGKKARAHVKIDTGLHRLGFDPRNIEDIKSTYSLKSVRVEGIFTHLALRDENSDKMQMQAFYGVLDALKSAGINPGMRHALDSIGMLMYPEYRLDAVRAGAWIYGSANRHFPDPSRCPLPIKVKARIAQIRPVRAGECLGYDDEHPLARDSMIATVTCGYYDGIPRACAQGFAVIRGKRAPLVGLVMMDQLTLDVTDIPDAQKGDEVTFIGDGISLLEASNWYHCNRNELIARMSRRVERIYTE